MKLLCDLFVALKRDQKGGVLIMVAISLVGLLGMTALAIDVGQLYTARRQMVNAADGAALAGAMQGGPPGQWESNVKASVKKYAEENGAENFNPEEDIIFANDAIHVRVSRQVDYTFAQVLGIGPSTAVGAVASARRGPGNGLVPFAKVGHPCTCCDVCLCSYDCDFDFGYYYEYPCNCENCQDIFCEHCASCVNCQDATCNDCVDCLECQSIECQQCDNSYGYVLLNENFECAQRGDEILLRYPPGGHANDDWGEAEFGAGNYQYIRFEGQQGGNDLRYDIGGGYEGDLSSVYLGTELWTEPGGTGTTGAGPLGDGLEMRMKLHGEPYCIDIPANPYLCEQVVIIPLVHKTGQQQGGRRKLVIVGYASLLLKVHDLEQFEVYGTLIDYLEYDELASKLGAVEGKLEGYTIQLIKTPEGIFSESASQ